MVQQRRPLFRPFLHYRRKCCPIFTMTGFQSSVTHSSNGSAHFTNGQLARASPFSLDSVPKAGQTSRHSRLRAISECYVDSRRELYQHCRHHARCRQHVRHRHNINSSSLLIFLPRLCCKEALEDLLLLTTLTLTYS
jgi:hypothetical protein